MRTTLTAVLLVFSIGVATPALAQNVDGAIPHKQLGSSDCINTSNINDWKVVDSRTAIVRTGPKRYLIKLQSSCPQLKHPPGLMFRTSSNAGPTGSKICGGIGESVRTRGQAPCAIQSVSLIDKAQYDHLSAQGTRYMKGKSH